MIEAQTDPLMTHLEVVVPIKAAQAAAARPRRFVRERFDDIQPKGVEWLVKHFLPSAGVAIIYGASTVGKSFVVLYIAIRVALGKNILGHKTRKAGVLYIAAEGQNGMRKRIKAVREKFSISAPAFQFIGQTPNLLQQSDVDDLVAEAVAARDEMLEECGVQLGLIIIDTTSASMAGGNENTSEAMSMVLSAGTALTAATDALVMFVAHPGKNEALGVRGWSGQVGNVDALFYLKADEEDPKLRIGQIQKLKDGEDGERFAYRLRQISMGMDDDGDEITSAYPVFEDAPVEAQPTRKRQPEDKPGAVIILRALGHLLDAGQCETVPGSPGVPPGVQGVQRVPLRDKAVSLGFATGDEKPESIKRSINREIAALVAARVLRVDGELVWRVKK